MVKPLIMIDFDGCILDFNKAFGSFLRHLGVPVPIGYVPDRPYWDEDPRFEKYKDIILGAFKGFEEDGFFTEPYPGAVEFLKEISEDWELLFCTARRSPQQVRATMDFIEKYSIPEGKMILSKDKHFFMEKIKPEAILEDSPHHLELLISDCDTILVPRMPYNTNPPIDGAIYIGGFNDARGILAKVLKQSSSSSS